MGLLLRFALSLVLACGLIGFGTCSMLGVSISLQGPADATVVVLALIGLATAVACGYGIYTLWKKKKPE